MNTIILHTDKLDIAEKIASTIRAAYESRKAHFRFYTEQAVDIEALREEFKVDINYLPKTTVFDFTKTALFVSDMDSTLINIECIDEIADFANLKPQVAAITEKAMQGELDFNASLIERVGLLKGLNVSVLDKVYTERLQVNEGGEALVAFLKSKNIKNAVVSGGFTYFTHRLAEDIELDYDRANKLEIVNNQLTGKVEGDIVNATAKAEFVTELCQKYAISLNQVIVAGDGANDLEMMKLAGLSVAYHAKPAVVKYADIVLNYGGLDKIMDLFPTD
ncbi:Phosphoserine phosphatase [uncultured Candidatus Thioglobus sp.]|nr:Phosphoserine phosphatase [uncultured Candidatus Thioglobus sp.]